jgi:hypothetical protein
MPLGLREANDFVERYHRHSRRTARDGGKWAIGAYDHEGVLWGVAIVGRTSARLLHDGVTAEIRRTCVRPGAPRNVNSFLYGRCWRIWQAMGGHRLITYTLPEEGGASLRGAGFRLAATSKGHKNGWDHTTSRHIRREWQGLFAEDKYRWEKAQAMIGGLALMLAILASWPAAAHDIYAGLKLWRPGMASPIDCCGGKDCAAYPHREVPGEPGYEALVHGQWTPLPASKVVGEYSVDGQLHLCCQGGGCNARAWHVIRCVVLPGAAS